MPKFIRYAAGHYGFAIPVWFARTMKKWIPSEDTIVEGRYRKHLFITWKHDYMPMVVGLEMRLRVGFQYL